MKRLLASCVVAAVGMSAGVEGAGTAGAPFLRIGVSARAAAMGDAFSVVGDGASVHYNPAAGGLLERAAVNATYIKWFGDLSYSHVGYVQPIPSGAVGTSVGMFSAGSVSRTEDSPVSVGEFTPSTVVGGLMYTYTAARRFAAGLTLKYLSDTLDTVTGTAVAADLGAVYRPIPAFTLGVSAQNLGSGISYSGAESEPLPLNIRAGMGYTARGFTGVLDVVVPSDGAMTVHLGGEYYVGGVVALRAGYRMDTGGADRGGLAGLCAGVGIKAGWFGLDYAFVSYGDLDSTHWVTLSYRGVAASPGKPVQPATASPAPSAVPMQPVAVPPPQPAVRRIVPVQASTTPAAIPARPAAPVRTPVISSGTAPVQSPHQSATGQTGETPSVAPAATEALPHASPAQADETPAPAAIIPPEGSPQ
jgi:hypothetical protein